VLAGVLPSSTSTLDEHRLLQASKVVAPPGKPVYSIVAQVGEGTFGKVYKARNSVSNVLVALKRIRMETEKDGFPVTAMREIKLLQSLRHDNIVRLYEMIVSNGEIYFTLILSKCLTYINRLRLYGV
jgi:CTD kinase subunit alpha